MSLSSFRSKLKWTIFFTFSAETGSGRRGFPVVSLSHTHPHSHSLSLSHFCHDRGDQNNPTIWRKRRKSSRFRSRSRSRSRFRETARVASAQSSFVGSISVIFFERHFFCSFFSETCFLNLRCDRFQKWNQILQFFERLWFERTNGKRISSHAIEDVSAPTYHWIYLALMEASPCIGRLLTTIWTWDIQCHLYRGALFATACPLNFSYIGNPATSAEANTLKNTWGWSLRLYRDPECSSWLLGCWLIFVFIHYFFSIISYNIDHSTWHSVVRCTCYSVIQRQLLYKLGWVQNLNTHQCPVVNTTDFREQILLLSVCPIVPVIPHKQKHQYKQTLNYLSKTKLGSDD